VLFAVPGMWAVCRGVRGVSKQRHSVWSVPSVSRRAGQLCRQLSHFDLPRSNQRLSDRARSLLGLPQWVHRLRCWFRPPWLRTMSQPQGVRSDADDARRSGTACLSQRHPKPHGIGILPWWMVIAVCLVKGSDEFVRVTCSCILKFGK